MFSDQQDLSEHQSLGFPSPFLCDSFGSLLQAAVTRVFILQTSSRLLKVILPNLERSSAACHKKGLALSQPHLLIREGLRQHHQGPNEYLIQATWPFSSVAF